jgi:hypothetical protein
MRRLLLLVWLCVACGDPKRPAITEDGGPPGPRQVSDAAPRVAGEGTCVGLWQLTQEDKIRSNCPKVTGLTRTYIVDVEAGHYRARHADGAHVHVLEASAPDQPCALSLRDFWYVWQEEAPYQISWELTPASARGTYEDLDAWNACTLEFNASVTRRDLRPADIAFDARRAADEFTSYWRTSCAPGYAVLPKGTEPVPAQLHLSAQGGVDRLMVGGVDIWFACMPNRCPCPKLTNASGAAQTVAVVLDRR